MDRQERSLVQRPRQRYRAPSWRRMLLTWQNERISAGELDELISAIRAGATYVNVHSTRWTGGNPARLNTTMARVTRIEISVFAYSRPLDTF